MEAKILLVVCLALVGVTGAQFLYDLKVTTAALKPQNARVFIILQSKTQVNNVSMSSSPLKLKPFKDYASAAQSPIPAPQLMSASFQWTTTNRTASAIKIKRVTVVPKYLQEPYRTHFTKVFCVNGLAFPNYVIPMSRC